VLIDSARIAMKRKLAAILAADVVGYSRLMERDEAGTLTALKTIRKQLLMPLIAEHQGRIFKLMGDGVLVEFASAVNAVACAVAVQRGMAAWNADVPATKTILLRVGINLGDVMCEGSDLHGEGVIVASRLEALAEPGSIFVSGKVRDEIARKLDLALEDLGEREVKNIASPVRVYRVGEPGQHMTSCRAEIAEVVPLTDGRRRRARHQIGEEIRGDQAHAEAIFVGRESELDALQDALDHAVSGRGRLIMLSGEPGIGKTRTAQELASRAMRHDLLVLWGRCNEESGAPPYWPWVQVIRSYIRGCDANALREDMGAGAADIAEIVSDLRQHLPNLQSAPPLEDPARARFRLFDSVTAFLRNAARRRPLMILIDDVHWADTASLRLLSFLAPEISDSRLMLVGTYRDIELSRQHPLSDTLGELARLHHFQRLALRGLKREDVHRFMEATTGMAAPMWLIDAVNAEAEGNPLFLKEIVAFLMHERVLDPKRSGQLEELRRGMSRGPTIRIPEGVREVIGKRLNRLSHSCNRVLTVASVIGREFEFEILLRLVEVSEEQLLESLEEALAARVIEELPPPAVGYYQFKHALIRETLYDELIAARRARLHHRVGEALEKFCQADIESHLPQLAHHFTEAAHSSDVDKAIKYAMRAGERAEALLAYEEAVRFYQSALQSFELKVPVNEAQRCTLLLSLAEAQRKANEFDEALRTLRSAADSAKAARLSSLFARAAVAYEYTVWRSVRVDIEAVRLLQEALKGVGEDDIALRAPILAGLARAILYAGAPKQAATYAEQAVVMARQLGDPSVLATSLNILFETSSEAEAVSQRLALATEMLHAAEQDGNFEFVALAHSRRMVSLLELGDIRAAALAMENQEQVGDAHIRQPAYASTVVGYRAMRALMDGRFAEVEQLALRALALAERAQVDYSGPFGMQIFTLRREQGRLRELEPAIRTFVKQHAAAATWRPGLALLYAELGREHEARTEFEELAKEDFGGIARDALWTTCMAYLTEVCVVLGDAARAATLYRLLLPYTNLNIVAGGGVICCGAASRYLAVLAAVMSHWEDADYHFKAALAMNAGMGAKPLLAHTQHDYAAILLARGYSGDQQKATALLDEALATARDLGMCALEERIVDRITDIGSEAKVAPVYPDELTPREVAVLRLIAIGRSNSDIAIALSISLNTVATHVRSILAKTGCTNRTEAAGYAMRQGLALTS
jgi:predicted ATPase/class 3 adenylate cyclase/DNA-binding CsgD family transcriptional regulator